MPVCHAIPAAYHHEVSWKKPHLYALLLFLVNLAVARRLFSVEFTQHLNSNEGSFISISRFLMERWPHISWFPFWFNGEPFENSYTPLLHMVDALFAKITHTSPALAFHAVTAFFYCLGPVLLFWMAWRMSGLLAPSFFAALVYSLTSPSVVFAAVRNDVGWFHPRRLQTLVHYGEGPHNVALALLPLAILCTWLALEKRQYRWFVASGALMGSLVLVNAFAAVDLVLALACLAAVQPVGRRIRGLLMIGATGAAAYLWISPFLTPTLIRTIGANSAITSGGYHLTRQVALVDLLVLAGAVAIYALTVRWRMFERLACLLAYVFFAIPALFHFAKITILPQAERYHLEMEMGVCLALFFTIHRAMEGRGVGWRAGAAGLVTGLMIAQLISYRLYARELIHKIDITTTIEYQTAKWIDANLHGLRVMVSDEAGTWFNVFSDNSQLNSGHDPFSPNSMVQTATFGIYWIDEAEHTVPWLKAYGCHAITVPGPNSRMTYRPFRNPRKFDGVLPLLWHQEDDSIFAVPQRSKSLAHVVPESAVVAHPPVNGLDTAEVSRFVAALDDPALPLAELNGRRLTGLVAPGQVMAVQITYDPGWVATSRGRPVPITRDGLGLMTLHPSCAGPCDIDLVFEGGLERRICWILSCLVMLMAAIWGGFRRVRYSGRDV